MFSLCKTATRSFSAARPARFAKMTLIGTIGTDLQKQTTSTGKDYIKYAVAVNSKTKAGESVSWFNIACFSPIQIEFMEKNLGKGAKIYLEADAKNTSYEKEDGTKAMSLMLFQSNFEVIKYPKKAEESSE